MIGISNYLSQNKVSVAAGSLLEWFDFSIYMFFSTGIAENFFPEKNFHGSVSILATYLILSVGFFARPLGALIFGYLSDRYGRTTILKKTPLLISIPTAFIAIIPSYNSIGDASILLLSLARVTQGLFIGGEFGNNLVYLYESSPQNKNSWSSVISSSASLGIFAASFYSFLFHATFKGILSEELIWRIAFLTTLPLGIYIHYLRATLKETGNLAQLNRKEPPYTHLLDVLKNYKILTMICILIISFHAASFYFVFIYIPLLSEGQVGLKNSAEILKNSYFILMHIAFIPLFSFFIDKFKISNSLILSILLQLICVFPCYHLILFESKLKVFFSLLLLSMSTALNAAAVPEFICKIVPLRVRATIISFSLNTSFGIFGGLTPPLCLFLASRYENVYAPLIYLSAITCISFSVACLLWRAKYDYKRL